MEPLALRLLLKRPIVGFFARYGIYVLNFHIFKHQTLIVASAPAVIDKVFMRRKIFLGQCQWNFCGYLDYVLDGLGIKYIHTVCTCCVQTRVHQCRVLHMVGTGEMFAFFHLPPSLNLPLARVWYTTIRTLACVLC